MCRKCYVHPAVLTAFLEGVLVARADIGPSPGLPRVGRTRRLLQGLRAEEAALLRLLEVRASALATRAAAI